MTAPTRRGLIQGGGALALARALPATAAEADVTGRLARYMAAARDQALPPEIASALDDVSGGPNAARPAPARASG